jgi:hypothetical protein
MEPNASVGATANPVAERSRLAVGLLRLGLGLVWLANVVFVVDPANGFFSSFSSVAGSFGGATLGGPGFASFVAANPLVFSVLIAATTIGLAAAFLGDFLVRPACIAGLVFNLALFVTQWGQTAVIPGGTDVGPHPVYIVGYLALFVGYQPGVLSVSHAVRQAIAKIRPTPTGSVPSGPTV